MGNKCGAARPTRTGAWDVGHLFPLRRLILKWHAICRFWRVMFSTIANAEASVKRAALALLIAGPIVLYVSCWLVIGDAADAVSVVGMVVWVCAIPILLGYLATHLLARHFKNQSLWLGLPLFVIVWLLIYVPIVFRNM